MSADRLRPPHWRGWVLNAEEPSLWWDGPGRQLAPGYTIDLCEMDRPSRMVFWIFQIKHKAGAEEALGGLLVALDELLDPQSIYAPGSPALDIGDILAMVDRYRQAGS